MCWAEAASLQSDNDRAEDSPENLVENLIRVQPNEPKLKPEFLYKYNLHNLF